MTKLRHILAQNIKKKRNSLGLSQAKLAEKVNTATTYIAMIELERRSPSFEMLERIAEALNTDPPDLFLKNPLYIDAINEFNKSILIDLENVIISHTQNFEKKVSGPFD